jgi:hypothetical protein
MRKITRHLKIDTTSGTAQVKNKTQEDAEKISAFLMTRKHGDVLREVLEVISLDEEMFDDLRSHYRAWLREFIMQCNEAFSNSLAGGTLEEKSEALHDIMKYQFCKVREDLFRKHKGIDGEEIIIPFTTSKGRDIDYDTFLEYVHWCKALLCELHKERYNTEIIILDKRGSNAVY